MKSIFSFLISLIPINWGRIFCYRIFLGYQIDYSSKIGMCNIIKSKNVTMKRARIGSFNQILVETLTLEESSKILKKNRFKNLNILHLSENAEILSSNFMGAPRKGFAKKGADFNNQNVFIGKNTSILRSNYFDVVEEITIGENVVFGGNGSEIWTHGFDTQRNMLTGKVSFGNNIFIGSNCIFTKNVSVVSNTTIGPQSVVYKNITEEGVYSSHELRKIK